jgi:hypothetical protein
MKLSVAALCALAGIQAACIAQAEIRPEQTHTALAAIDDAKALVAAGRGQLLLVGSALTTEQTPSENVLVVLEYPLIRDMKPGMILILARNGCKPIESCLIARRVAEVDGKGELQTDPYTGEGLLFGTTKATILGIVSYAIDLETDSIRDMRAGTARSITLAQAIADEEAQAQPGTARF